MMTTKIPKVNIPQMEFKSGYYVRGKREWKTKNLYDYALEQKLKPFDLPLAGIDLSSYGWSDINSLALFIDHAKRVFECDLKYPILLDDFGQIADGNHRIVKAIIEGRRTIKAIRLNDMPEPDIDNEEE